MNQTRSVNLKRVTYGRDPAATARGLEDESTQELAVACSSTESVQLALQAEVLVMAWQHPIGLVSRFRPRTRPSPRGYATQYRDRLTRARLRARPITIVEP